MAGDLTCFTVCAPYGSLIATGRKTIETRSWATKHRGRVGIHQGGNWEPGWLRWYDQGDPKLDLLSDANAYLTEDPDGSGAMRATRRWSLPLGVLVATAELVDCVPIIGEYDASPMPCVEVTSSGANLLAWTPASGAPGDEADYRNISDQLPVGIWKPGDWAWLLDDVKSTSDRCPACWGTGVAAWEALTPEQQAAWVGPAANLVACPTCDGLGRCVEPVSATGRRGLWSWAPGVAR